MRYRATYTYLHGHFSIGLETDGIVTLEYVEEAAAQALAWLNLNENTEYNLVLLLPSFEQEEAS